MPNPAHPFPIPRTPEDFARVFHQSRQGQLNRAEMMAYWHEFVGRTNVIASYNTSTAAEKARCARRGSSYMITVPMQVRAVVARRVQILKGDMVAQAVQLGCVLLLATLPEL